MRRIALSLVFVSAFALGACSGGGSVLSVGGNNPERVVVTTLGSTNVARVLPASSIALSATGVRGSINGVAPGNSFRWSAVVAASGVYPTNTNGGTKPCQGLTLTPTGGVAVPYAPDFSQYLTIDPTNQANVIFTPPAVVPNPTPATATLTTLYDYCVVVTATSLDNASASGSITVAVVNPQLPLN